MDQVRTQPMPWWIAPLLAASMAKDGGTHFVSQLAGLRAPASVAGSALSSPNCWVDGITGSGFGAAVVGLTYPLLDLVLGTRRDLVSQLPAQEPP